MSIVTMIVIWIITCAVLGNRRITPPQWGILRSLRHVGLFLPDGGDGMSRAQFESYYAREQLPCLSSIKERHWQTWLEAQATLLSAHGPAVELKVLDESYSKGWKDCMEIAKK